MVIFHSYVKLPEGITGWWYTYPSEKYESQLGLYIIPNIWKNKIHVPNHQPDHDYITNY